MLQQGVLDGKSSVDCDALSAALAVMLISGVGEAVDGGVGKAFLTSALETGEYLCFLTGGEAGMGGFLAVALFFYLVRLGTILPVLDYAVKYDDILRLLSSEQPRLQVAKANIPKGKVECSN